MCGSKLVRFLVHELQDCGDLRQIRRIPHHRLLGSVFATSHLRTA